MNISKPLLAALITAMFSVLAAAAKAYVDVQVLKNEVVAYREDIREIKLDIREIRNALSKQE
jgi:hypothetical protein